MTNDAFWIKTFDQSDNVEAYSVFNGILVHERTRYYKNRQTPLNEFKYDPTPSDGESFWQ